MPRIEPVSNEQANEAQSAIFDSMGGKVPNIFRTMAHAPAVLTATAQFDKAVQGELPGKFRELAFLQCSLINECHY